MLLCAQFPTFLQFNFRPLPETLVKVESCGACDLVRFRLYTWPTVSTYLCPSKVQTASPDCILGLLSPPTSDLVRFRLHTWPTVSTNLCPSKVQIVCLAYCIHLPLPG